MYVFIVGGRRYVWRNLLILHDAGYGMPDDVVIWWNNSYNILPLFYHLKLYDSPVVILPFPLIPIIQGEIHLMKEEACCSVFLMMILVTWPCGRVWHGDVWQSILWCHANYLHTLFKFVMVCVPLYCSYEWWWHYYSNHDQLTLETCILPIQLLPLPQFPFYHGNRRLWRKPLTRCVLVIVAVLCMCIPSDAWLETYPIDNHDQQWWWRGSIMCTLPPTRVMYVW